jgi:sugar phosphate isomerase/epimerase
VTALPGARFDDEPRKASLARAADELAWRVERASELDIVFGVEAHIGSIVPRPASAGKLVTRVPGLTLTLDYTHFARAGVPDAVAEPLVRYASHFHIRGARKGRLQTSFADNAIDYARVIAAMDEAGYSGWLGIEYVWTEWERCNECDNLSETILFRDYISTLNR